MIQTSLAKRIALIAAGGLMSCLFAAVASSAAEIKVLTSVALTSAFNELAPNFEQATGNKLNIGYSLIADIRKRMLDGETADVIILSRPVMDELDKQQKFASGSITNVAGTPVALAIRAGAPKPDISTVDALKRTLLAAKSIVYADPAKGGASGVYFAKVVDRLGITDQLKPKTILVPGAQAPELVAAHSRCAHWPPSRRSSPTRSRRRRHTASHRPTPTSRDRNCSRQTACWPPSVYVRRQTVAKTARQRKVINKLRE